MKDKKILIIDDNEDDRLIIKRFLNKAGYEELSFAKSGEEGVEKAKAEKFNLVITDTLLPGIDGFLVCKKIKEIAGKTTKVIVVTGNINAVDAYKARKFGADDYIVKTKNYLPLIEVIKKLL